MDKKYIIIGVKDGADGCTFDDVVIKDDVKPVYLIDNKFKELMFETARDKGLTDIENRADFDRNIEVYKILQEARCMGYDKVTIEVSGITDTFNKEEIEKISEMYENDIGDIDAMLKNLKGKIDKMKSKEPKIVVYTCITGGYDNLIKPTLVTPGVDYVCFTDNKSLKSDIWKIRPIPEELLGYTKVKQQRGVKILPHRYLPEYDISIWIDANVDTKGNLKEYLKSFDFNKYSVFIPEHPRTKCIYKEKETCVRIKKITGDQIALAEKQMKRYKDEGFPENYGLVQSNIVIRKHNDEYSKKLMEMWWAELSEYSHRDQLSFNYALWKVGNEHFKYLIKTTCNSRVFKWRIGHKK